MFIPAKTLHSSRTHTDILVVAVVLMILFLMVLVLLVLILGFEYYWDKKNEKETGGKLK